MLNLHAAMVHIMLDFNRFKLQYHGAAASDLATYMRPNG